jgi:hypothetical protein
MAERASGEPGTVVFRLACFYARTSQSLHSDPDLAVEDRNRLAQEYAKSAVRLLVCAEQVGFFGRDRPANRQALGTNADLKVLHARVDYQELAARLGRSK